MQLNGDDNDWDKVSDDIPEDATAPADQPELVTEDTQKMSVNDSNASNEALPSEGEEKAAAAAAAAEAAKMKLKLLPPQALQIVSIGTEQNEYAFTFHEEELNSIIQKVPMDCKVCVVSVVGAFRTGKSFLLSWFLQYLAHHEALHNDKSDTNKSEGGEGECKWYEKGSTLGNQGFNWRGGAERNTTGIWMWSKPFLLPHKRDDGTEENVAVLLVDTQGMFDHETTMGLTAAIFGLSTLLSSKQIYNVDKRIQEDNLQQLALFAEYGRLALQTNTKAELQTMSQEEDSSLDETPEDEAEFEAEEVGETKETGEAKEVKEAEKVKKTEINPMSAPSRLLAAKTRLFGGADPKDLKPFQKIEFLVRDWQNFEDDEDLEACEAEMETYLQTVLADRAASDLKDTREQILSCFEEISCFLMTHPGFAVTKKKYTGEIDKVDPTFKMFMDRYCTKVFENLVIKSIHGRELTAAELGAYVKNYAMLFESGAHFPEAATMLEATASANNSNATNIAIRKYREEMEKMVGPRCMDYLKPGDLERSHRNLFQNCTDMFDDMANFGNPKSIQSARRDVLESIQENFELFMKLNESRNPLLGFETYIIPLTIGALAILLRWIADSTCTSWSTTCKMGSDVLSHIYQVVFFFLVIVASTKAKQLTEAAGRVKKALEVLLQGNKEKA